VIPPVAPDGNLPPGIHLATWPELVERFGVNAHRRSLLEGLYNALVALRSAGCPTVWINGGFVTLKEQPGDYDGCWEIGGVRVEELPRVFLVFEERRAAQKERYRGEWFPVRLGSGPAAVRQLAAFQIDHHTERSKGIIVLELGERGL